MRIASPAHAIFAATMIVLGIIGIVQGDFAPIWQPVPKNVAAREVLVYVTAAVTFACGAGLLWQRAAAWSARVLLALLVLWLLAFKLTSLVKAPAAAVSYESAGETAVIVAAAWILYAEFATDWDRRHLSFAAGDMGVRLARSQFGLSLIAFGVAHFAYVNETAALVPAWLPWHVAWVDVTGAAYIAAGIAVLLGVFARWAATLAAWQMGAFTAFVWLPAVATGPSAEQWSEFVVSWTLVASAWIVAASYGKMSPHARHDTRRSS